MSEYIPDSYKNCKCGARIDSIQVQCTDCVNLLLKSSLTPFKVGDSVQAFGNTGTVKSLSTNGLFLEVSFSDSPNTVVFTIDGKVHSWNNSPSLRKL